MLVPLEESICYSYYIRLVILALHIAWHIVRTQEIGDCIMMLFLE